MRLALVIIALVAIAVTRIQIYRAELTARCEIQRMQLEQIALRRTIWDQQAHLAHVMSPDEVRRRAGEMAVDRDLVPPDPGQKRAVSGLADRTWNR